MSRKTLSSESIRQALLQAKVLNAKRIADWYIISVAPELQKGNANEVLSQDRFKLRTGLEVSRYEFKKILGVLARKQLLSEDDLGNELFHEVVGIAMETQANLTTPKARTVEDLEIRVEMLTYENSRLKLQIQQYTFMLSKVCAALKVPINPPDYPELIGRVVTISGQKK